MCLKAKIFFQTFGLLAGRIWERIFTTVSKYGFRFKKYLHSKKSRFQSNFLKDRSSLLHFKLSKWHFRALFDSSFLFCICTYPEKKIEICKQSHITGGTLDILFSSNHNIHKNSCGLSFWTPDPFNRLIIVKSIN